MAVRAVLTLVATVLLPAFAQAEVISTACAVEFVRRDAVVASDYKNAVPQGTFWVSHDGQTQGPWTLLQIKREMVIGRLPTGLYFYDVSYPNGWQWSAHSKEFEPLPGDSVLGADDLGEGLSQLLTGCWVSDPTEETPGQETTWLLLLFESGEFIPSRGVRDTVKGDEGFWFSRTSTADWTARSLGGSMVSLHLPDITYFEPLDDFTLRVIDRNTLSIDLPGTVAMTFRRM